MTPASDLARVEGRAARAAKGRAQALADQGDRQRVHGVVDTPSALAGFAVRRADHLLRSSLGLARGLADPRVALLDPALGTGTWLAAALAHSADSGPGPARCLGLELMPEAAVMARDVLGGEFEAAGWPLEIRVSNTLGLTQPWQDLGKAEVPVVLGNPPWSGRSASRELQPSASWLADFHRDASGAPLGERRAGVLSDDYVRFFRWCAEQVRVRHAGGLVCLVTNGSFLDGSVHRGMRARLLEWFDQVELLDLGGNALLSRAGGEAQRDQNVFGVRPGVVITWALKMPTERTPQGRYAGLRYARLRYARLRGTREQKLAHLAADGALDFEPLEVDEAPHRFLPLEVSRSGRLAQEGYLPLDLAMPFHREGVQTNRDALVTDGDRARLLARLRLIAAGDPIPAAPAHLDQARARLALAAALERDPEGRAGLSVAPLAYRPLEQRWFAPVMPLCHRPRPALARALGHGGWALLSVRKDRGSAPWRHVSISPMLADNCYLSTRSSCRTRMFPACAPGGEPNLSELARELWASATGLTLDAEQLALYALGVLSCPSWQDLHGAMLRLDYPRLPVPANAEIHTRVVQAGAALRDALWTSPGLLEHHLHGLTLEDHVSGCEARLEAGETSLGFGPGKRISLAVCLPRGPSIGTTKVVERCRALIASEGVKVKDLLVFISRWSRWTEAVKGAERACLALLQGANHGRGGGRLTRARGPANLKGGHS